MAKGRKRKPGKRTKTGRLSRAGVLPYDRGTDHAQAIQAFFGQDGADAIGRAYRSGLLGEGADAKAMLDTARKISQAYWAAYTTGPITCTLGDKTSGQSQAEPSEAAVKREQWLNECMDTVNRMGRAERRYFDQLVVDINPDNGPAWLDRLVFAQRTRAMQPEPFDLRALIIAIERLATLAGVQIISAPMKQAA